MKYRIDFPRLTVYAVSPDGSEREIIKRNVTPASDNYEGLNALAKEIGKLDGLDFETRHRLMNKIRVEAQSRGLIPSDEEERAQVARAVAVASMNEIRSN